MKKTLALALLLGGLLLPSAAFAYSPSVALNVSDVYTDDLIDAPLDWTCTDLGYHDGALWVAAFFYSEYTQGSTAYDCSENSRQNFISNNFEGQNTDSPGLIVIYDEALASQDEFYNPGSPTWLESGAWFVSSSSIPFHSTTRP